MKSILVSLCMVLCLASHAQDNPWRVVGKGVIGFIQTDSVWVGKKPDEKKLIQAINGAELWPEMTGQRIFGAIVWPCFADSAGWYKVHKLTYDSDGEDMSMKSNVAYVKHSDFVEFQTWEEYLKGKYIYDVPATMNFYKNMEEKSILSCRQSSCLQIVEVKGNWAKVVTPSAGCRADTKTCITEAWIQWTDGKGKLLVQLRP
jgi:hypothetical protein